MINFIFGVLVGGIFGVVLMCLVIGGDDKW
jgi:hypothetical protein